MYTCRRYTSRIIQIVVQGRYEIRECLKEVSRAAISVILSTWDGFATKRVQVAPRFKTNVPRGLATSHY